MANTDDHTPPSRFAHCQPNRGSMRSKGMQFQRLPYPKFKTTKTIVAGGHAPQGAHPALQYPAEAQDF